MADFGDIQNSIAIGAGQAIRRNAGDTDFEAFTPGGGAFTAGVSTGGNTIGTTGTVNNQIVFAGGNNVTLSQSTAAGGASVTISGANQSNQSLGIYGLGNTSGTSSNTADARSLSFSAGSGITVDMTNNQVNMSVQPPIRVGVSTMGNTAGSTGTVIRSYVLVGSNAATLSQSTAAGGQATVTIDVPTQTIQTQNMVSVEGSTGNIDFANANGVTFGFNASTITASHNGLTTAAQSDHSHGNPTLNLTNLSGTTASASNGLTLSLSAAAPGGGAGATFSSTVIGMNHAWAQSSSSLGQNSVYIQPHILNDAISAIAVKVPVMITNSSLASSSGQIGHTVNIGIYTRNATNSTVLTQHYSTSYTAALSNSSNASRAVSLISGIGNATSYNSFTSSSAGLNLSSIVHGAREFLMPVSSLLSGGEYWFAYRQSTSGGGTSNSVFAVSNIIWSSQTGGAWGATSATSLGGAAKDMGLGRYSTTTGAMPSGISLTQINKAATQPIFYILPVTS